MLVWAEKCEKSRINYGEGKGLGNVGNKHGLFCRLWRGFDHIMIVYSVLHHSLLSSLMHIGYSSFHCLSYFARGKANISVVGNRVVIYIVIYIVKNYSLKVNSATIIRIPSQPSRDFIDHCWVLSFPAFSIYKNQVRRKKR